MSKTIGDKQKWMLALAYRHEQDEGEPTPITQLNTAFFSYSNRIDTDAWQGRKAALAKSELFQTRRAVRALIKRGLMEEAGTVVHQTGGSDYAGPGRYNPKGYSRICKAYRLTEAGRVVGKAEDEASAARLKAMEDANPKLKRSGERIRAATGKLDGEPPAGALS